MVSWDGNNYILHGRQYRRVLVNCAETLTSMEIKKQSKELKQPPDKDTTDRELNLLENKGPDEIPTCECEGET